VFLIEVEREFRAVRAQVPPGGFEGKSEVFRVRLTAQQDREMAPGNRGVEFGLLEQVLERVLGELEGKRLAELEVFDRKPPSLENLAQFIYRKAEILLERGGGKVDEVGVESSKGRRVRYRKTLSERPAIRF
jgi:6-pyruvoyl-tetrahydropterin synthase